MPRMAAAENHNMAELNRGPPNGCRKLFIQRDYEKGTAVKFQTKFPPDLARFIERHVFERTINEMNAIYEEAEKMSGRTFCEGCLACMTAYLAYICMETHYDKCLKRIAAFIDQQNETEYVPKGLYIVDPVERGLRVIEICILNEPATRS